MKTKQTQCKYKVESGVPIPNRASGSGRPAIYPFENMKVGDSILIKDKKTNTVRQSSYQWSARRQKKMVVRAVDGGVRVWRIK